MLKELEAFAKTNRFRGKGPLSVAIYITDAVRARVKAAADQGSGSVFPLDPTEWLAESGTQVRGLNSRAVQSVLKRHGIDRELSSEAGRTSRGSAGNMRRYVEFLNEQAAAGTLDLDVAEKFWVDEVAAFFAGKPFTLKFDTSWGIRRSIRHLVEQAMERQKDAGGTMYLGTLMQHLVGAKLDVLLGPGAVEHHSANQSDQKPGRYGDFDINDVAIHVTSAPGELLVRKCRENLGAGKRPIIVTLYHRLQAAEQLLEMAEIAHRVDLIDFEQFMATNIFEIGKFSESGRADARDRIVEAYNAIIDAFETPSLRIEASTGK